MVLSFTAPLSIDGISINEMEVRKLQHGAEDSSNNLSMSYVHVFLSIEIFNFHFDLSFQ